MKAIFRNHCGHADDEFVGRIEEVTHNGVRKADVYVYWDNHSEGQHVCIRYGDEPAEYMSPGSLDDFLLYTTNQSCFLRREAAKLLKQKGKYKWECRN